MNTTPQIPPPTSEPYIVIAAELATYSAADKRFSNYHRVLTWAFDEETACKNALRELMDGYVPVAAFTREDILDLAGELKPGNMPHSVFNLDLGMRLSKLLHHLGNEVIAGVSVHFDANNEREAADYVAAMAGRDFEEAAWKAALRQP
ncbi:MAG TPA: hypothetical protein VGM54_19680 [Chthoniobacter sp.]|jgi:hypothetical protein